MRPLFLLAFVVVAFSGCLRVSVDPIKIDHTITLKVEREVENFLDELYGPSEGN